MVTTVCDRVAVGLESAAEYTISGKCPVEFLGVCMEQEESGDKTELFGVAGFYSAVFALGVDGV